MKQPAVIVPDKPDAGGRRTDNGAVVREILEKLLPHLFCFIPETTVESHLTTAGLVSIKIYRNIEFLQDFNHVHPRIRINLVDKAGYKNIY